MSFNKNSNIVGQHAFLSPSTYNWLDAEPEKLVQLWHSRQQARLGDELHDLAQRLINLGVKLPDKSKTLNMYVNDAIGYRMSPEVPLFYTRDCFGTADAVCIRDGLLRIHDLKTGITAASMKQLLIYAGIFFFEYGDFYSPKTTKVILRIYQNDGIDELQPDPSDMFAVMSKMRSAAQTIASLREED